MKIVLIIVFILTACGLFLLLSGILKLPTLRTGRAMMQSGKKEKKPYPPLSVRDRAWHC